MQRLNPNIRHSSGNLRSNSAYGDGLNQADSSNMDILLNKSNAFIKKDAAKNADVRVDGKKEDVMHANDVLSSPNFLRIPLKPIGTAEKQRSSQELINEKRFVISWAIKKKIHQTIVI